jgi:hypothetical protein
MVNTPFADASSGRFISFNLQDQTLWG